MERRPTGLEPATFLEAVKVPDGTIVSPFPENTRGDWHASGLGEPLVVDLEVLRARLVSPAQLEINPAGRLIPQVSLSERRAALPSLQRIQSYVHLVLSEFAQHFPSRSS